METMNKLFLLKQQTSLAFDECMYRRKLVNSDDFTSNNSHLVAICLSIKGICYYL